MINQELLNHEVQDFISKHLNEDVSKIVLQKSPFKNVTGKELAEQIQSKKTVQKKLPLWYSTPYIIYPPKLNLEQSSSEQTALYKTSIINKNDILIDITGGFGIDDFYFAKKAKKVIHCELNTSLSEIVKHNSKVLKTDNIDFYTGDGITYLKNSEKVNVIYADPSRRTAAASRVFLLEDCEPNVAEHLDLLLEKADKVIIKVAPMLDIDAALQQLKQVTEVHIVSLNNECKELLFVLEKQHSSKAISTLCVIINHQKTTVYSFNREEEKTITTGYFPLKEYLYEPDVAFLKAGLFKSVAKEFSISKIHQHSHLYTSDVLKTDFPGRILHITNAYGFKEFSSQNTIRKANVVVRNFYKKPDELKKKFKIQDGGNTYIYFTTDCNNNPIVIVCKLMTFNNT